MIPCMLTVERRWIVAGLEAVNGRMTKGARLRRRSVSQGVEH